MADIDVSSFNLPNDNNDYHVKDEKARANIIPIDIIYPVGSIYISVNNVNPGTYMTGTTWAAFGSGKTIVGVDSNDTDFDTVEETGGVKTVKLTSAQSGVPSHAHTYTRPTVSSSGYVKNGITGGGHTHTVGNTFKTRTDVFVGGSSYWYGDVNQTTTSSSNTHTHDLPNHTHTLTGGGVANNTAADASQAHTNLQPYITVYMWKRTA